MQLRFLAAAALAANVACGGGTKAATDSGVQADAVAVDVALPDGPPTRISVTLDGRPTDATKFDFHVAYQDGDRPWAAAPAASGDTYSFTVNSSTWSVAWTCGFQAGSGYRFVMVVRSTVAERTQLEAPIASYCTDRVVAPTTHTLTGNLSNFDMTASADTPMTFESVTAYPAYPGTSYQLTAPAGTADLLALHTINPGGNFNSTVDAALVARGVALTSDTTLNLDWANAVPTSSTPMTINGAPSGSTYWVDTLLHASGTTALLMTSAVTPPLTESLGAAQEVTTDLYEQHIWVGSGPDGKVGTRWRTTITGPTPTTDVTAPALFSRLRVATSFVTPTQVKATWPEYAGASGYTVTSIDDEYGTCGSPSGSCYRDWYAMVSPGAACAASKCSAETPDLSAAGVGPEFDPTEAQASTSVSVRLSNVPGDFPDDELVPMMLEFLHVPYPVPASGTTRTLVMEQ